MDHFYTDDFFDLTHIVLFNSLGQFFLSFLIPFIAVELIVINGITMGILFSLPLLGYFLSSFLAGYLSDKYSKKHIMIIGSIGRGIAYLLLYFAIISLNLNLLFISNFLLGFLSGFFSIPFDSLVADKTLKENRSQAYGIRSRSSGKGTFIGAFIGFTVLLIFNPNRQLMYSAILIFSLANFYASVKYFTKVSDSKIHEDEVLSREKDITTHVAELDFKILGSLVMLFLVTFFFAMEESIVQLFIIPYFLVNLSSNESIATFVYIPVGLVSIILGAYIGKRMDKVNYVTGFTICAFLNVLTIYLLIQTNIIPLFSLFLTFNEILTLAITLLLVNIFSSLSKIHRGKFLGFQTFLTNFGGIIGSFAGGYFWEIYSMHAPFLVAIVLNLIIIPFFIVSLIFLKDI